MPIKFASLFELKFIFVKNHFILGLRLLPIISGIILTSTLLYHFNIFANAPGFGIILLIASALLLASIWIQLNWKTSVSPLLLITGAKYLGISSLLIVYFLLLFSIPLILSMFTIPLKIVPYVSEAATLAGLAVFMLFGFISPIFFSGAALDYLISNQEIENRPLIEFQNPLGINILGWMAIDAIFYSIGELCLYNGRLAVYELKMNIDLPGLYSWFHQSFNTLSIPLNLIAGISLIQRRAWVRFFYLSVEGFKIAFVLLNYYYYEIPYVVPNLPHYWVTRTTFHFRLIVLPLWFLLIFFYFKKPSVVKAFEQTPQ